MPSECSAICLGVRYTHTHTHTHTNTDFTSSSQLSMCVLEWNFKLSSLCCFLSFLLPLNRWFMCNNVYFLLPFCFEWENNFTLSCCIYTSNVHHGSHLSNETQGLTPGTDFNKVLFMEKTETPHVLPVSPEFLHMCSYVATHYVIFYESHWKKVP